MEPEKLSSKIVGGWSSSTPGAGNFWVFFGSDGTGKQVDEYNKTGGGSIRKSFDFTWTEENSGTLRLRTVKQKKDSTVVVRFNEAGNLLIESEEPRTFVCHRLDEKESAALLAM